MNNGRVNVIFRMVYNPQEGRVNKENLKKIYEGIQKKKCENQQKKNRNYQ